MDLARRGGDAVARPLRNVLRCERGRICRHPAAHALEELGCRVRVLECEACRDDVGGEGRFGARVLRLARTHRHRVASNGSIKSFLSSAGRHATSAALAPQGNRVDRDAAHAMTPNLGQGRGTGPPRCRRAGAVAPKEPLATALAGYAKERKRRCESIVARSRAVGRLRRRRIHLLPSYEIHWRASRRTQH